MKNEPLVRQKHIKKKKNISQYIIGSGNSGNRYCILIMGNLLYNGYRTYETNFLEILPEAQLKHIPYFPVA